MAATETKRSTIASPRVRLMGSSANACAIITYIRVLQTYNGRTKSFSSSQCTETRVWERKGATADWKHVHFHRTAPSKL